MMTRSAVLRDGQGRPGGRITTSSLSVVTSGKPAWLTTNRSVTALFGIRNLITLGDWLTARIQRPLNRTRTV